jgi:polyisoprenoid-binding protein YceI
MKSLPLALSLSILLAAPAFAADTYTIDPNHTWPVFEVNHLGFSNQRGRFDKTAGKVTLDLAAKTGSVDLTIDTRSLDMGFPQWNEHLAEEGFFDSAKYPTITFKSDKLIFNGNKVVAADGQFTLLGVTKPLRVAVADFRCGANPMNHKQLCGGNITATIKRSDFGMTKFLPAIGDEVKIYVPVEAYKD